MTKAELKEILVEDYEFDKEDVETMSDYQLVNSWLRYNGIIGYTYDILDVIGAAYNIKLLD